MGIMGHMTSKDNEQFDLASVFPAKGDPRKPPEWYGRALLYTAIGVFASWFVYKSWGKIEFLVLDVVISIFIALALEPLVKMMIRHGWRRGAASGVSIVLFIIVVIALMATFGSLFVQQATAMISGIPQYYEDIANTISSKTSWKLPAIGDLGNEILGSIQTSWVRDFAGQAISTTMSFLSAVLNLLTVLLVTFYISASGPKMRRSVCQWMSPKSQRKFVLVWTVAQDQISSFLFSRTILAIINSGCLAIFLVILHVPYWLPLSLFCGLVSQFVPTIGTYIGGALPIVAAWASVGLTQALAILAYIIIYQQIENLIFAPKISQRTMDLNPAVAFLSVLGIGAVFGALGAFLALPVAASFQAIFKAYTKHYELIDSPLLNDPKPVKKSKVIAGAEAFNEHVIRPVAERMPRAARGSSSRIHSESDTSDLQDANQYKQTMQDLDTSETIAIPQKKAKNTPLSAGSTETKILPDDVDQASDGNPRNRWH